MGTPRIPHPVRAALVALVLALPAGAAARESGPAPAPVPFRVEVAMAGGALVPFDDTFGGAGSLDLRFTWATRGDLRQGLRLSCTGGALDWARAGDDGGRWWVAGGAGPGGIGRRATFLALLSYLVQYEAHRDVTVEFSTGVGAFGFAGSRAGNEQPWIPMSQVGLAADFWVHRGPRADVALHAGFDLAWYLLVLSPIKPVLTPRFGVLVAF